MAVSATFDVIGVGTNSVDHVLRIVSDSQALAAVPKAHVDEKMVFCGGQTATLCCACAGFGLQTAYVGAFGSDQNGALIRAALRNAGVDISDSTDCEAPNRDAVIILDRAGRRTVFWHRDGRLQVNLERLHHALRSAKGVHVDDDDAALAIIAARMSRERGIPVTSDIEHLTDRTEELISAVTYPIFNDALPAELSGESDPERALRKLRRLNAGVLCMTLGSQGAIALEGDRVYRSSGFDVAVVDSTGAGDAFRAGFVYARQQTWDVGEALRFANAAGALSCTRLGAIASVPTLADVRALVGGSRAPSP